MRTEAEGRFEEVLQLPRRIGIITPENVEIEYELAGLASRGGAAVLDLLLQAVLLAVVAAMLLLLGLVRGVPGAGWAKALLGIVAFAIIWGYYVLFETIWNGQTPGKRYSGIRTVREYGLPVDLSCTAVRNLIRFVDFLPALYTVGTISVLVTRNSQRLGDLAAGTLVVKERAGRVGDLKPAKPEPGQRSPEAALVKNIELVTTEEFNAAKRFHDRKAELRAEVREEIAAKIARPLMTRLGIEDSGQIQYSNLLSEIYIRCGEERGMQ